MSKKNMSKRMRNAYDSYDSDKFYSLDEAVDLLKSFPKAAFDETVEISMKLGVDSRHADQIVRGSVVLPHGLGKNVKVLVFAKGVKVEEAKQAGADYVGDSDLIAKIENSWFDFDVVVAAPDMMKEIAKIGRLLGTRGLMPNPKNGTVTENISSVVKELKAGRLNFRVDKANDMHLPVGKVSFEKEKIAENIEATIDAIVKAKPSSAKGQYLRKISIASTMGPGLKLVV